MHLVCGVAARSEQVTFKSLFFFFLETKSFLLIPLPPFFSLLSAHNPPSPGLCLLEIKREKSSQALTWQNVRYHGHPLPVSNKLIFKNGNEIITIFKTHERIELWYRSGKNKSESTFDGTRRMIGGGGGLHILVNFSNETTTQSCYRTSWLKLTPK